MNTTNSSYTIRQIENIMDIAVALLDYTESLDTCCPIPGVLASTLGIRSIALAVVRLSHNPMEPDYVVCCSSEHTVARESVLLKDMRGIYRHIQPSFRVETPNACQAFHALQVDQQLQEIDVCDIERSSRVIVFTRPIDAAYRLLLMVEWHIGDAQLTPEIASKVAIIAMELSKQLRCAVAWKEFPMALGAPFDRLSKQELKVLSGLNTELAEKQLAAHLGLSRHTLHSHIKSIYRKVRVQGRIALLQRLRIAIHRMRLEADSSTRTTRHGASGSVFKADCLSNIL
jgi:DNA-binding CsgD family transcriptional regulator